MGSSWVSKTLTDIRMKILVFIHSLLRALNGYILINWRALVSMSSIILTDQSDWPSDKQSNISIQSGWPIHILTSYLQEALHPATHKMTGLVVLQWPTRVWLCIKNCIFTAYKLSEAGISVCVKKTSMCELNLPEQSAGKYSGKKSYANWHSKYKKHMK